MTPANNINFSNKHRRIFSGRSFFVHKRSNGENTIWILSNSKKWILGRAVANRRPICNKTRGLDWHAGFKIEKVA